MPSASTKQVFVFDSAVPDLQVLIDAAGPGAQIILLDAADDGVLQLAQALAAESALDAIHIFSHGAAGSLQLGSAQLNLATLPSYSEALAQIGQALSAGGDILLYGCNVGEAQAGQAFVAALARATGADVAASADLTGNATLGGDWVLEQTVGSVEATALFVDEYPGLLPANTAPAFGVVGTGKITTDIGSGSNDFGYSVTVQADGKIVVAGSAQVGSNYDFALARYNLDGSLDTSFDGDGKLVTDFGSGSFDQGYSVTVQADGKIVVAGGSAGENFAVTRYNADGSLDTSFDGDGKLVTDIGSGSTDIGTSVTVQADGKIVVAGYSTSGGGSFNFAVTRYNADGSLDTSFDGDGKLVTDFGSGSGDIGYSVTVQADGKIVVAGSSNSGGQDFAVTRYNANGSLDTSFDGDGKLVTDIGSGSTDIGRSVTVQADGKIVVAGGSNSGGGDFAVTRYNANGSLDTSFDGDGKLVTDIGSGSDDQGRSVTVQADGKIVVAGYSNSGGSFDFAVTRYNVDGSLDTSFDGDGKLVTDIGIFSSDEVVSVTVQADGKIVVAGRSNSGGSNNFAVTRYNADGSLDTSFNGSGNTLGGTVAYTEGAPPIALDSAVTLIDADLAALNGGAGNYAGASLALARTGSANAQDQFGFSASALFTVSGANLQAGGNTFATFTSSAGTLTVAFTSSATPATQARVNDVLSHITYANSSDAPPASVQIDWSFSDGGGLSTTGSTTVTITPVNDAPTAVILTTVLADNQIAENTDTASRIKVADIGVADDGQGTNAVSLTGADAASFEIHDGDLYLRAGVALNYENKSSYAVLVSAIDSSVAGSTAVTAAYSLGVTNVNEAPTAVILTTALTANQIAENTDTASRIKVADIGVTDDALGANTVTLTGADAASFEIHQGDLYLRSGVALNYEGQSGYTVTVRVVDSGVGGSAPVTATYTLGVTDINEAPTAVILTTALTDNQIAENTDTASRIKVADIGVADDGLGTNAVSLTGADAASFEIHDGDLYLRAGVALNYENKSSYAVLVSAIDSSVAGSTAVTAAYSLGVTNVNEAPTAVALTTALTGRKIAENTDTGGRIKVADVTIFDDALGTNALTLTGADAASFEIHDGDLYLRSGVALNYEGQSGYTVTVSVVDSGVGGSAPVTATYTLSVTNINEAPSFLIAGDGLVTTDFGSGYDIGYSVTTQTDGKILVAGYADIAGSSEFALARYNPDGSLDTRFSDDGKLTTDFATGFDIGYSVTVQSDGKILVAGSTGGSADFALARYTTDGSLDTSFSGDGKLTTDFGSGADEGRSVTVQADGKILIAGYASNGSNSDFALVRYNANGSLDTSFSGDGKLTTDFGSSADLGLSVTLQADGKILVAGSAGDDLALARYNPNGSLDTSFSGDGKLTTDFGSGADEGLGVTVQADGKILVAGYAYNGSRDVLALARYNVNGSLDTSFSVDGKLTTGFGVGDSGVGYSVTLQADGKILVAGYALNGTSYDLALARYTANGSLDTSFSDDGKLTTDIGSGDDFGLSIKLQADGKILVAGGATSGGSSNDLALARYNPNGSLDTSFDARNTLDNAPTLTEQTAGVLDGTVQINDPELAALNSYAGASVTLTRHGGASADDQFSASGNLDALTQDDDLVLSGVVIGAVTQNEDGTLVLTFNADATQARVNETLSSIQYLNDSDNPPEQVQIDWTFSDGGTGIAGASTFVSITPVNDAPTGTSANLRVPANQTYTLALADFGFVDEDAAPTGVRIDVLPLAAKGTLLYDGASLAAGLTLTAEDITDGLLTFRPPASPAGQLDASFRFSVMDSEGLYDLSPETLRLIAPTATNLSAPEVYTEDRAIDLIDIVVTSVDSPNVTATLTMSDKAAGGLTTTSSGIVFSHYNTATGVWSATGPVANVNKLLSVVLFRPASDFNGSFTIATSVSDGVAPTVTGTKSFTGLAVDDRATGALDVSGDSGDGSTAVEGGTLTASLTGAADVDAAITATTYQWQISANGSTGWSNLSTGATLTLASDQSQVGKYVRVVATTTDASGGTTDFTGSAQLVANVNDAPTGEVTISGTPAQGQTLTAVSTLADIDGLGPISYQWLADGSDIAGAIGSTLTLAQAQVGKAISVRASYTDLGGTTESLTSTTPTPVVANVNEAPTGGVTVSGTPAQGQTLTVANTLADGDGLGPVSYQWRADGGDISGATGATLTLSQAQVGKAITVKASYVDGDGLVESITSAATAITANVNDAPTGGVTVSGTPANGQTLTAVSTLADSDGLGLISYQWLADGTDIAGATGSTLKLALAQVGQSISVRASYTDLGGTPESLTSAATPPVANANEAPVANASAAAGAEDTVISGAVTASDIDSTALTYSLVQPAAHGTANVNADGSYRYTPNANYNGLDSFTFKASDASQDSNLATVSLTVTAVNDAPLALAGARTGAEDTVMTGALTASDIDSTALTYRLEQPAGHGTVSVNADGSYRYTPDANYNGPDSFTFRVSDASLDSNLATVSLTVTPVNDAPVALAGARTGAEDTVMTGALTASDIDSTALTYRLEQPASHGTVNVNADGSYRYTPNANYNGPDSFTFRVSDASLDSSVAAVSLTVNAVNDALSGSLNLAGELRQGQTLSLVNLVDDPDGIGPTTVVWLRNGAPIAGASGNHYLLVAADVGSTLSAQISYIDGGGTLEGLRSGSTATILVANPAADGISPAVVAFDPADGATGVAIGSNIGLTFSELISRGTGSIVLKTLAGTVIESFDAAASTRLAIAGNTLTIDPSANLAAGTRYLVEFPAGAIRDVPGNAFAGTTGYDFTTIGVTGGLTGTNANDQLVGTPGNDTFTPRLGNDVVNGGDGVDTVVLPMFPNVFHLEQTASGRVSASYGTGAPFSLTLNDVENVQFGTTYQTTIPLQDLLSGEAQLQLARLTDLYLAFFGRAPDVAGLEYWQEQLLEKGRDLASISVDFAWSAEAQALFPLAASNRAFVQTVFVNSFGRQPDAGGWDYWTARLDGQGVANPGDRGVFVGEVILGAYAPSSGPQDQAYLTNRHEAALYYANQLSSTPTEGFDAGILTLLARVTGDPLTADKAERVIDYVFANPVTLTGVMTDATLLGQIWGA